MSWRRLCGLVWALACPGHTVAAVASDAKPPTGVWAKPGADLAATKTDETACAKASSAVPVLASAQGATPPAAAIVDGVILRGSGYVGELVAARLEQKRLEPEYVRRCMRRAGYGWVEFTPEEQAALDTRPAGEARNGWIDAFLAGDLSNRIEDARRPFLPLISAARTEPMVVGGARFDAAEITLAHQMVVQPDTTILTGTIGHRRTARLRNALDISAGLELHADAGTIMHQVVAAGKFDPQATYWCGPMQASGRLLLHWKSRQLVCITNGEEAYEVWGDEGPPFLAQGPDLRPDATETPIPFLVLDESDDDLIGPMAFALVVRQVYADSVALEARATRGGRTVAFWKGDVAFGPGGKAVLPFWSHRLTITNRVTELRIAYTADGDGTGWDAAKLAPGG
jgi:hypothetical protein